LQRCAATALSIHPRTYSPNEPQTDAKQRVENAAEVQRILQAEKERQQRYFKTAIAKVAQFGSAPFGTLIVSDLP
jgi:hypothetical protein